MQGPRNNCQFPILSYARVVGYDTVGHGVFVSLPSLQTISFPAKVLMYGNADGTRVNQEALPVIGTMGLIAVPFGDTKSAIWLGSFYPTSTNAITTSNPPTDEDSQIQYYSHASGEYSILDYVGNYFQRMADGSQIRVNTDNTEPTTYRHLINDNSLLTLPITDLDRNPYPPGPFFISVNHPSGASFSITPSGFVTVQGGNPQLASMTISPSGDVHIQTGAGSGQTGPTADFNGQTGVVTIVGQNGHSTLTMDSTGNIVVQSGGGNVTIQAADNITVQASGAINIEADGGDIFLATLTHPAGESIDTIIAHYNTHVHSGVTSGPDNSGVPTIPLP